MRPDREGGGARSLRVACGAAVVALACAGPGANPAPGAGAPVRLTAASGESRGVPAEFEPALRALQTAVASHEDELARRILEGLMARDPRGPALEAAQACERILDGRALVAALEFRLEAPAPERASDAARRLQLAVRSSAPEAVRLRLPPASLQREMIAVAPDGVEYRSSRTEVLHALEDLELEPGRERLLDLGEFEIPIGAAIAARARIDLVLRSGEIHCGGRRLPAARPRVRGCEAVRLAAFLPTEALGPEPLLDYARGERIAVAPLLERAVRIPPERRAEALEALAPLVAELPSDRVAALSPAFRWLARSEEIGADGLAWRAWFSARGWEPSDAEGRPGSAGRPALDLPGVPGGASGEVAGGP